MYCMSTSYSCCYTGMDLLGCAGGGGGVPLARGVLFFMIKQKIIRDKMRYSVLSNNMMIMGGRHT